MKHKKKGTFFTFIFSFLPGAAEMYMGFMKNGLSLMTVFFILAMVMANSRHEGIFAFFVLVIWFYGFFHARNLAGLDDVAFMELEDRPFWEELADGNRLRLPDGKLRKATALFLIIIGACILWGYIEDLIYALIPENYWDELYPIVSIVLNDVPQVVLAVILIVIGVVLIRGKKKELETGSASGIVEVYDGKDDKNA